MSLHLDLKYINLVSPRFESFAKKKDFLYSCRCPICGDSKKNRNKMRGYIFRKDNGLFYKCHNCGIGLSVGNLIRHLDESLYKKYILERYSQGENGKSNFKEPTFTFAPVKFDKVDKKTEIKLREQGSQKEIFCLVRRNFIFFVYNDEKGF